MRICFGDSASVHQCISALVHRCINICFSASMHQCMLQKPVNQLEFWIHFLTFSYIQCINICFSASMHQCMLQKPVNQLEFWIHFLTFSYIQCISASPSCFFCIISALGFSSVLLSCIRASVYSTSIDI